MPLIPQEERIIYMTEFIFFIVGLLLGGCIGVVFMCCLQINRLYKTDSMKKEVEANEKKNC